MKVLWFTNTAVSANEYLNIKNNAGGWMVALADAIKEEVDLHIAFNYARYSENFTYNNISFHPICNKNWKFISSLKLGDRFPSKKEINKYLSIIDEIKPDLIHIHGTENSFGMILRHTDTPVVISIQGNITVIHHKFLSGIEKKYLKTKNAKFYMLKKRYFSRKFSTVYKRFKKQKEIEKEILQDARHIIGRTTWDKRITRILAPHSKYYHCDEIMRKSFYEHQWTFRKETKIIIYTTISNSYYKGFETICHSISLLNQIGFIFEWHIAGINNSDLINKIVKKKLKSLYPDRNLVLLGQLNENEIIDEMLKANIYVMASHIENSPNNLCEAMLLGLPSIVSYAGGTGDILTNKQEGILIQDGDPWVLAGAIHEFSSDKDRLISYGANARKQALKRHDPITIKRKTLEIYQKILSNG